MRFAIKTIGAASPRGPLTWGVLDLFKRPKPAEKKTEKKPKRP